jgi:hypothetical protein
LGVPVLAIALVVVVLCGGGVAAASYGARYLGGLLTGDESGFDVLAQEVSSTAGPLTLTVNRVVLTAHFTRVEMTATNAGSSSIDLPLYMNCILDAAGARTTLPADSFKSDWTEAVPGGGRSVTGTVTFDRIPDGSGSISISFSTIYGSPELIGKSITVADIPLTAT